jgi:hypothetical protein
LAIASLCGFWAYRLLERASEAGASRARANIRFISGIENALRLRLKRALGHIMC